MRKLFVCLSSMALFFTVLTLQAQDEMGGIPYSFSAKKLSLNIPQMNLPFVDHLALLEEDAEKGKNSPLRIATSQLLNYTMDNSGRLDILNDGSKLWRVNIKSPNAYAIFLHFSSFEIPKGAELFVYTPDQKFIRGKYTQKNENEEFYVLDLPGDEIIVEYYEPAAAAFAGHFEIESLGHLYRDVFAFKGGLGQSQGNCHLNVKCPEVDAWLNQVNSVVCIRLMVSNGSSLESYLCSGAMIANTRLDRTPYVYSAAHCFKDNATWYFHFDYQSTSCENNSGNSGYAVRGCEIRAIDSLGQKDPSKGPDFLLLEITGNLPKSVLDHLYFSGWDISTSTPLAGAAIHHPGGDFKKYSKPRQYSAPTYQDYKKYYWQVNWVTMPKNKGVVEPGSSGSPLFNAQGYIVGSLSRGSSDCNTPSNPDFYGRISASWTFGTTPFRQLKHWLDPDNTGITMLAGKLYSECSGIDDNKTNGFKVNIYPNPTNGNVKINGNFNGETIQCNIYSILGTLVYQEQGISSNEFELNLDLMNGIYFVELQGKEKRTTHKLVISK